MTLFMGQWWGVGGGKEDRWKLLKVDARLLPDGCSRETHPHKGALTHAQDFVYSKDSRHPSIFRPSGTS